MGLTTPFLGENSWRECGCVRLLCNGWCLCLSISNKPGGWKKGLPKMLAKYHRDQKALQDLQRTVVTWWAEWKVKWSRQTIANVERLFALEQE